mgnify:CR=1 FL=1
MMEERHYAFFQNTDCEYFPCHKTAHPESFQLPVLLLPAVRPRARVRREFLLHEVGHQKLRELHVSAPEGKL